MRSTRKTALNTPDGSAGNRPGTTALQNQPQSPALPSHPPASPDTPVFTNGNRGSKKRSTTSGQNALGIFSRLGRLQAVDNTITLDTGLYLVELVALDLPTTRANGVDLPLVHIRASDARGSPVPITRPDGMGPWLGGAGGTVFVEAPLGGARVTLTAYAPENQPIPRGKLTVRRLGGAAASPALGGSIMPSLPARSTAAAVETPSADDRHFAEFIESSGLFDARFYLQYNHDAAIRGGWAARDYVVRGEAEGQKPNPYFDPVWYSKKYFSYPPPGGALRDYVQSGERQGRKPCAVFDPSWYAATYGLELNNGSALTHYLRERRSNTFSPNSYFDVDFYLDANPEIAGVDVDGFAHWLHWGIHESRKASPKFNAEFVWQQYLNNNRDLNAFEKFMDIGLELGWDATGARASDRRFEMYRELKRNCAPGPLYEPLTLPSSTNRKSAKILAFYLPQFHAIPENDAWWGTGFTEWHNIPRGVPRYAGHYQPRIPRDFGFYNLDTPGVMRRQVELAHQMGLFGFCFYYYNFDGHRLLEKPVDAFLADSSLDFPFCLIWANENWTRRWDGREREMLIRQGYRPEDVPALVADIARHMHDPRYIRAAGGRPLLIVYRADAIPECAAAQEAWRNEFRSVHGLDPLIVMGQTFGMTDPRPLGFDGALEFPPHNLGANLNLLNRNRELEIYDVDFQGFICDYNDIVAASMAVAETDFPVIKTAFPGWDNDARRQGAGMSFANSTPQAFQRWLEVLIERAEERSFFGEPFVCVNAWNEWCEGAYLEPDIHFGHAYLNAVARAITCEGDLEVARSSR
jgi:hypothetical protein